MSKSEFDLEMHFLPAWAQEEDPNRYANYSGETKRDARRGGNRDRRSQGQGGRPGGPGRGPSNRGPGGPNRGPGGPNRGPVQQGGQRPNRGDGNRPQGGQRRGGQGQDRGRPGQQRREVQPLLELNVTFKPDDIGVESLARQIRMTGRAYPLFDIAQMILRKPERHSVTIAVKKQSDGKPAQRLFTCALDATLHLSEAEAVRYVLTKHFDTFYQPEKTQIDAPKGTYTFVAQCGMSGVILGPPNHHDYQNQLRKLHAARFARMPFEGFKARVKIVRDEEVVKKWIEDQSWKTEYIALNMPEPVKLANRDEVEKHFRETHLGNIISEVENFEMSGQACRDIKTPSLLRLVRSNWEDQKRFPLQVATVLSQQFAGQGLQFFKVDRTVTHVAVARPRFLDLSAEPVSDGVKKIVDFVEAHPKCTRRKLFEALLGRPPTEVKTPETKAPEAKEETPAPAPASAETKRAPAPEEGADKPAEAEASKPEGSQPDADKPAEATAANPTEEKPAEPAAPEPPPEETAIAIDLHWLIHQGHVIEFANGLMETAKKPAPKPEKKKKKQAPKAPKAEGAAKEGTKAADSTEKAESSKETKPAAAAPEGAATEEAKPAATEAPAASTPPPEAKADAPKPATPEAPEATPAATVPTQADATKPATPAAESSPATSATESPASEPPSSDSVDSEKK